MTTLRVGSLCTGYGGIELGLAAAGVDVDLCWYAELEPGPAGLLAAAHPGVPNLGDITSTDWTHPERVDLICGGIPCQPTSNAGRQLGDADPRWLWPATRDALAALLPHRFLLENVRGLVSHGRGRLWRGIVDDLTALGYGVRWLTLGACAVGLAHHRHRVFLLATFGGTGVEHLPVAECGAPRGDSTLLPTATARDGGGRGTGTAEYWQARRDAGRDHGMPLDAALALLPTPSTSNANGNHVNGRGEAPLPGAVQPERWGRFALAIDRHADALGVAPPEPTEPNRNGNPRVSPAFVEWLMGVPAGHVTGTLPRGATLKALGNGVSPPQLARAWSLLTTPPAHQREDPPTMATTQQAREASERLLAERATAVHDARVAYDAAAPDRAPASPAQMIPAVRAAILAMAATWSAQAVELEGSTKRGSVGYQKELRSAATLARGFALWTDPEALYAAVMAAGGYAAPPELIPPGGIIAGRIGPDATLDQQLDAAFGPLDQPTIPSIEGGGATVTPLTILAPGQDPTPPARSLTGPPVGHAEVSSPGAMTLFAVAAPPERLTWEQIREAGQALRGRGHVSPSTVMGLAECSLAWLIDHAGLNRHETPAWWLVGGTAFHSAIEQLEQNLAAGHSQPAPDDIHRLWTTSLASAIDYQIDGPDTAPQLWRAANKGLENGAWWSVEGEAMIARYVAGHGPAFRERYVMASIDAGSSDDQPRPAVELEHRLILGATAVDMKIDQVWFDRETQTYRIVDLKTGHAPPSRLQNAFYAHAWAEIASPGRVLTGQIGSAVWDARAGSHDMEIDDVRAEWPLEVLEQLSGAAMAIIEAGLYLPRISGSKGFGTCGSCAHSAGCPAVMVTR